MALLKKTLVVGFVLFGIIPLIHACWLMDAGGKDQCQDYLDYSWHPHGSTWTNRYCVTCTCRPGYMVCCSEFPKSVSPGCTLQKDFKTCKYTVIKSDPSVECKVNAV
ncbi:hypothetical protein PGIGA_G00249210 [Pangasianodon gigas]|uniref:Uncharacterized protein n=1 Tax=Pangasianodon gigas TaxID=30993 RepID=A0ACC5WQR5_PANGG|nr:hypothetical protein [Pangasianodon gigas]